MTLIENGDEQSKIEKRNINNKVPGIVNSDLISVKKELFTNPRFYIQNLLNSLKARRNSPFSAYKIDLSLTFLKGLYEKVFPQKKHGGHLSSRLGESNLNTSKDETYNVKDSFTLRKDVLLSDRAIIKILVEGIKVRNQIPSFVELISTRVSFTKTAIQNRIRVGKSMFDSEGIEDLILLYRKKETSHSKILKEIRKIDKRAASQRKLN